MSISYWNGHSNSTKKFAEMEWALTLTRFLMHLYLKKLILEVPNTIFEGVMDRAAMFYNYNRYLQIRCDIKGNQLVPLDSCGLRMNRWVTKHLLRGHSITTWTEFFPNFHHLFNSSGNFILSTLCLHDQVWTFYLFLST